MNGDIYIYSEAMAKGFSVNLECFVDVADVFALLVVLISFVP